MRTSNFLNIDVWVENEENTHNITDMTTGFTAILTKNDPHQRITLNLSLHSKGIKDTQIGFFKERYIVLLELFDASQNEVVDSTSFYMRPLNYKGFDIQGINRDSGENDADVAIEIELLNVMDEEMYITYHNVFDKLQYKDVFNRVIIDWKKDKGIVAEMDEPFGNKKQDQFFIPEMKWQDVMPYVMNKGYAKENEPNTYFGTSEGLHFYRLEKSKNRKKIETVIFPDRPDVKDFNEIFVSGFNMTRLPKHRLVTGKKQRIFETSLNKNLVLSPHRRDPELNKEIWLPDYLDMAEHRTMETFDQHHNSISAINSYRDGVRSTHKLHLTITRWSKFDYFYPIKHIFKVSYTGESLTRLNDEFFVSDYSLIIERHKNEIIPKVELTLEVVDVK